ncbi:MAG TPA: hypothetical protein ENK74_02055, partial [Nitratifractor sp.]|nr:hypothetical protein [Nitratifractor sp.]
MLIVDCRGCSLLEIIGKVERVIAEPPKSFALLLSRDEVESFGYGTFVDIASTYLFRFLTPELKRDNVLLRFEALNSENSFHSSSQSSEKYGVESDF